MSELHPIRFSTLRLNRSESHKLTSIRGYFEFLTSTKSTFKQTLRDIIDRAAAAMNADENYSVPQIRSVPSISKDDLERQISIKVSDIDFVKLMQISQRFAVKYGPADLIRELILKDFDVVISGH